MTALEGAKLYYPHTWNDTRIDALFKAGKLTAEEAKTIKEGK